MKAGKTTRTRPSAEETPPASWTPYTLIWAQFLLSLAALWLHYSIHPFIEFSPPTATAALHAHTGHTGEFLAFVFGILDVILVTGLFLSPRTVLYGYLLNGMFDIFGAVMMAHFSIAMIIDKNLPFSIWVWRSTMPDITVAFADFLVGRSIYFASIRKVKSV